MRHQFHHHFNVFFGRRGPGGHRGFGRFGHDFMAGGMGGRGFGMGRKLGSGELQLLILKLLAEKPRYGYEIIRELDQLSKGFYVPSPGMVYPALTYLEEIGHAVVEIDGARKLYNITAAGHAHLQENQAAAEAMFGQFSRVGERMEKMRRAMDDEDAGASSWGERGRGARKELQRAIQDLRTALSDKWGSSSEEQQRIALILQRAAAEIQGE